MNLGLSTDVTASRATRARAVAIAIAIAVTALVTPALAPATAAAALAPSYNFVDAVLRSQARPYAPPPGANDWSCRPTAAHPRPVVLVHGTGATMNLSWRAVSPELKNRGYCVFALNYGRTLPAPVFALSRVDRSARHLAAFVDRVLAATGAAQVDVVGHSQGGMMPRQYLRFEGGAAKVAHLVGFVPSNHGVSRDDDAETEPQPAWVRSLVTSLTRPFCAACVDQIAGSSFMRRLNDGGDTVPGVRYTVITTRYDEIVTPWTSALLTGEAVTNLVVQDGCEQDRIDHAAIVYDRRAVAMALRALDPTDPTPVPCARTRPWVGG